LHFGQPRELDLQLPGVVGDPQFDVFQFLPEAQDLPEMIRSAIRPARTRTPLLPPVDVGLLLGGGQGLLGRLREVLGGAGELVDNGLHPARLLPVRGHRRFLDRSGWALGGRGG